eukprot:TRINITY_DN9285_c0_g1_i1.p1 TRINITY_DN9285_c0_g1~~TRINITY_DN9285_c0_g1_i1.p1  ORF type:complete len:855 (+),score=271.93 TRINITY_DN9285_c0_g1_i1:114-2678(+)
MGNESSHFRAGGAWSGSAQPWAYMRKRPDTARDTTSIKCVLLGPLGVGKTALAYRLLYGTLPPDAHSTMGANRHNVAYRVGSTSIAVDVWDVGNIERYSSMVSFYVKHHPSQHLLVVLMYDICDSESFRKCMSLIKAVRTAVVPSNDGAPPPSSSSSSSSTGTVTLMVVGNKIDQEKKREVKPEDLADLDIPHCEISCRTGENVKQPLDILGTRIPKLAEAVAAAREQAENTLPEEPAPYPEYDDGQPADGALHHMRRIHSEPVFTLDKVPSKIPIKTSSISTTPPSPSMHASSSTPSSPSNYPIQRPRRASVSSDTVEHKVFKCFERTPKTAQRAAVDIILTPSKIIIESQQKGESNNDSSSSTAGGSPDGNNNTNNGGSLQWMITPVEGLFRFFSKREYDIKEATGKQWTKVVVDTHHKQRIDVYIGEGGIADERFVLSCGERDHLVSVLQKLLPGTTFIFGSASITRHDFVATYRDQCRYMRISPQRTIEDLTLLESHRPAPTDPPFTTLDMNRTLKEPRQAHALAEAMRWNASVHAVDLSYNGLGAFGLAPFCRVVPSLFTLTSLDLSNNGMGPEAAHALGAMLTYSPHLVRLLLDGNALQDAASIVATALVNNTTLKTLGLSHNNIDSDVAVSFARTLVLNTSLQSLDLSYNDIHEEASMPLLNALECNVTLTRLAILGNPLADDTISALTLPKSPEVLAMLEEKKEQTMRVGSGEKHGSVMIMNGVYTSPQKTARTHRRYPSQTSSTSSSPHTSITSLSLSSGGEQFSLDQSSPSSSSPAGSQFAMSLSSSASTPPPAHSLHDHTPSSSSLSLHDSSTPVVGTPPSSTSTNTAITTYNSNNTTTESGE